MASSLSPAPALRTGAVLLIGVALFAALYWAGLRQVAWIGFVVAGLLWNAIPDARLGSPEKAGDRRDEPVPGDTLQPIAFVDLKAGTYVATSTASRVTISVRKLRVFTVRADFQQVSASMDVDPRTGWFEVRGSVPVGTFRSGNPRRDLHVLGPAFLDAGTHPSIRFQSTGIDYKAGGCVAVTGDLTLHGHTQPVTWDVRTLAANPSGTAVRAVAETSISRSAWGVSGWQWLAGDTVQVRVDILASGDE